MIKSQMDVMAFSIGELQLKVAQSMGKMDSLVRMVEAIGAPS
jgi:hypothetical protein